MFIFRMVRRLVLIICIVLGAIYAYDTYQSYQGSNRVSKAHTTVEQTIEENEDTIILACRVFPTDNSESFHVVSFIHLKDNLIVDMDEYWSDDGLAPEWRKKMKIGKRIR